MIYEISIIFKDKKGIIGTCLKTYTDRNDANKEYIRLKNIPLTEIKTATYKTYEEYIKKTPKYIIK